MLKVLFFLLSFSTLVAGETQGFLTKDEIALFHKQGYLLKRQCISPEEIDFLQIEVASIIDRSFSEIMYSPDQSFSDGEQHVFIDGSKIVFKRRSEDSISISRINGVAAMNPALKSILRSDKMVRTFSELLGTNELEHIIVQLHPKIPGDGVAFPKHRDIQFRKHLDPNWKDIMGNGSYGICIIPIDPMSPENGGLWVDRNNYPEPQGLPEDLEWISTLPGDVLFMNPYLFHGSGPNLSKTASRKTLLTGFCAYGANHKQYPGADVNVHITLMEDGTIKSEPAPWSTVTSHLDANH